MEIQKQQNNKFATRIRRNFLILYCSFGVMFLLMTFTNYRIAAAGNETARLSTAGPLIEHHTLFYMVKAFANIKKDDHAARVGIEHPGHKPFEDKK